MEISYTTSLGNLQENNGFGVAGYNLVTSLQRVGYKVPYQSPTAPVEIAFCQPDSSEWSNPDAYHIQYTPWESSELPDGWVEAFNENCDEVWATSPLVAKWYKDAGVTKPIFVYQHGIKHDWSIKRRRRGDVLKFLHVGEPAERKGGQAALEAFRDVFGDRKDVRLTIKAQNRSTVRVKDRLGSILGLPNDMYDNVIEVFNDVSETEMISIYHRHDALIYPGWGEGFGLIPLQGLATGMPVVCTEAWAPYARFLLPELALGSELADNPWPIHKGKMFAPNYDDLLNAYRALDEDFDRLAGKAYRWAFDVHKQYDWDHLTKNAFERIRKMF
jgi:glycosyltransferase involved in cell wall biosynthesis